MPIGERKATKLKQREDTEVERDDHSAPVGDLAVLAAEGDADRVAPGDGDGTDVSDEQGEAAVVDPGGPHDLDPDRARFVRIAKARLDHAPPAQAVSQGIVPE